MFAVSPFGEFVCDNLILPKDCKLVLFLFFFQFAQLIVPYLGEVCQPHQNQKEVNNDRLSKPVVLTQRYSAAEQ